MAPPPSIFGNDDDDFVIEAGQDAESPGNNSRVNKNQSPEPRRPAPGTTPPARPTRAVPPPVTRPRPVTKAAPSGVRATRPTLTRPTAAEPKVPASTEPKSTRRPGSTLPPVPPVPSAPVAPADPEPEVINSQPVQEASTPAVHHVPEPILPTPEPEVATPALLAQGSVPVEPPRPLGQYDEDPEDSGNVRENDLSEVEDEGTKKKKGSKKVRGKGKKGDDRKAAEAPSGWTGGRKHVLIFRIIVWGVLGLLVFLGAKSILFPANFPSPQAVIERVQEGFGITDFPTDRAEGFVVGFTKQYLTYDSESRDLREESLLNYAPEAVLSTIRLTISSDEPVNQTVTTGPFINGVESKDDTNAVFTVAAEINGAEWVYLDVPVVYDAPTQAFAISGSPSFAPPPSLAVVPGAPSDLVLDDDATEELAIDMDQFLSAWALADRVELNRYVTPDAEARAKSGLGSGIVFSNTNSLTVYRAPDGTNPNIRDARVEVAWGAPGNETTTFTQTYDLTVQKLEDGRWYIKDIRGGVPSESGGGAAAAGPQLGTSSGGNPAAVPGGTGSGGVGEPVPVPAPTQ